MPKRFQSPRAVNRSRVFSEIDALEPRQLLAARHPTVYEQYMLELVNRARANPAAEATRLGISLNEGLAAGTISTAAKQPLAINHFLVDAARSHSFWLQQNSKFQHAGPNNNTPAQRMATAGYTFSGSNGHGENIGMTLSSVTGDMSERTHKIYRDLFVDAGVDGRGHRLNMLNGSFDELGIGITQGSYTYNGSSNWNAVIATQDFAYTSGNPFITGVAFRDNLVADNFYSPGEGLTGITVTARSATGQTYTAAVNNVGGYALQVPAGTYTVTATSTSINGQVQYNNVVVGSENVKYDIRAENFVVPPPPFATLQRDGKLLILGTNGNDVIEVRRSNNEIIATRNGENLSFLAGDVTFIEAYGLQGNDSIRIGEDTVPCKIDGGPGADSLYGTAFDDLIFGGDGNDVILGGGGSDTLHGGAGNDEINGGGGKDYIHGDDGDDRLSGAGGADQLYGGGGNDRLYGNDGDDWLEGGGNVDRLYGGEGNDYLFGGSSNDRLYGEGGNDIMTGNHGTDYFDGGTGSNIVRDRSHLEIVLNAIAL